MASSDEQSPGAAGAPQVSVLPGTSWDPCCCFSPSSSSQISPRNCLRSARGGEATRWQRYLQSGRLSWGCERGWGCCPGGGELLGDPQRVILKNHLDSRALLFQRHDASHRRQRGDSTRAHRLGAQHLHFHMSPSLKTLLTRRIARVMPKLSLVSLVGLNFKGCIPRGGSGPGAEGSGDPPAPIPISVTLPGLLPELGSPDLTAARDCRHDQVELALTQAAQECVTARNLPGTPVLLLAPFVTSTARIISAARLAEPWYMKGFRGAQVRMPSVKPT